jgi:hypothetical protein
VDVEIAEVRGEARLLLRRYRLIAEEQDLVLEQRLFDGIALFCIQVPAQVDAADVRAQR